MSKEIHILTGNKRKWLLSAPMMHNCEIIIITRNFNMKVSAVLKA